MACPNCNSLRTDRHCYVHNVMTCINCLYDGVESFCDDPTFVKQSVKYKAEKEAEYKVLLDRIKAGGDTWVPQ